MQALAGMTARTRRNPHAALRRTINDTGSADTGSTCPGRVGPADARSVHEPLCCGDDACPQGLDLRSAQMSDARLLACSGLILTVLASHAGEVRADAAA